MAKSTTIRTRHQPRAGAVASLKKPFRPAELIDLVNRLLIARDA